MFAYISIARPDHWFKNVFMLLGTILAFFYSSTACDCLWDWHLWQTLAIAFTATCLAASSNYVINEILDAPTDRSHPKKRFRPIPSGKVWLPAAYAEWILLGIVSLWIAWQINLCFFLSTASLLIMGMLYNIPPIRSKELPYLDVLSESINNPIRLLLGWFTILDSCIPPLSLMIAYWMAGAYFMAAKRWAELKSINNPHAAAEYRNSFRWYTPDRLLCSMFYYAIICSLFLGVFIVRYRLELILSIPLIAGFFTYYLKVTFQENSPVQTPENLYKQRGLMIYLTLCGLVFFGLMFTNIPCLYELFRVEPSTMPSLWTIGSSSGWGN